MHNTASMSPIVLDKAAIMRLIPHRAPMLLVEHVTALTPHANIQAFRRLCPEEVFFQGHFPDRPILPGVLAIEALAQTAGVLAAFSIGVQLGDHLPCLISVSEARFRFPVYPGDRLDLFVAVVHARDNVWKFAGRALVGEVCAAEAVMMATVVPRTQLDAARPIPANV